VPDGVISPEGEKGRGVRFPRDPVTVFGKPWPPLPLDVEPPYWCGYRSGKASQGV
jgi:hypothetical protein